MVPQAILNCNKSDFFDIILFHKISSQGALLFLITGINPSNLLTFVRGCNFIAKCTLLYFEIIFCKKYNLHYLELVHLQNDFLP